MTTATRSTDHWTRSARLIRLRGDIGVLVETATGIATAQRHAVLVDVHDQLRPLLGQRVNAALGAPDEDRPKEAT